MVSKVSFRRIARRLNFPWMSAQQDAVLDAANVIERNPAVWHGGKLLRPDGASVDMDRVQAMVSEARITTWSNRAALVAAGLTTAFFTDVGVGGSHWDYTGGRWRPQSRRVMLSNLTVEQITQATVLGVMYSYGIPAGLWQDGDILEWRTSYTKSGGTAETATTDWRLGDEAATAGLTLGLSGTILATMQTQQHSMHRMRRLTSTTARNLSIPGSNGLGISSSALATRTIPDADAATVYWQALGNLSVGAETLSLTGATLYLETGA